MRKVQIGLAAVFVFAALCIGLHMRYLYSMTATETYKADNYLDNVKTKRALVITAHDDDGMTSSGTVAKLISEGWEVRQVCFKDASEERCNNFGAVAKAEQLAGYELLDIKYRNDLATTQLAYMPQPYSRFDSIFNKDTVLSALSAIIGKYQPSIIFSLDDSVGGYGHPDHVFMSQMALACCKMHKAETGFSVKKIYQAVFPPSMAEAVIIKNSWTSTDPYTAAKQVYNVHGMPLPDVEVDISKWGKSKMAYFKAFGKHEQKTMQKFAPAFQWYPYQVYFNIFNKEYFRVIDINA